MRLHPWSLSAQYFLRLPLIFFKKFRFIVCSSQRSCRNQTRGNARDQLGPNATQREINNYVGQLFEVNGITNARTIQPVQMITLPDADTTAATGGLQLYGKDIALGLRQQAQQAALAQAASERYAQYGAIDNASAWSFKEASMAQRQLDDRWAAGFPAANGSVVMAPADDSWNIGTRLAGAAQVLGGLGGAALSSTAIVAGAAGSVPTGGVSLALSALGYGGLVVSADQVSTGLHTLISGQPQRSLTGQGIEYATGASPQWSEVGASILTLSPAAGEAYLISQGTRALGAYNAAARSGYAGADNVVPYGFASVEEFAQFGSNMRTGLIRAGYVDVEPILQGSAVTGKSFRTGQPFDAGRVSDFDVGLASPSLMARAEELGVGLRSSGTRTGPLTRRDMQQLGLKDLSRQASQQAGRDVNFMIYDAPGTATQRAPSIVLPNFGK